MAEDAPQASGWLLALGTFRYAPKLLYASTILCSGILVHYVAEMRVHSRVLDALHQID